MFTAQEWFTFVGCIFAMGCLFLLPVILMYIQAALPRKEEPPASFEIYYPPEDNYE